eukprot:5742514-Pyramimonas_sp.AAC.1
MCRPTANERVLGENCLPKRMCFDSGAPIRPVVGCSEIALLGMPPTGLYDRDFLFEAPHSNVRVCPACALVLVAAGAT